jgi:hypothetical protein
MSHLTEVNFKNVFFLGIVICFLTSCKNKGEWVISDFSKDTILTANTRVITPAALILEISGYASDSIEVKSVKIGGGKIQEEFRFDHYHRKISVKFSPYKAKSGNIKIRYYIP